MATWVGIQEAFLGAEFTLVRRKSTSTKISRKSFIPLQKVDRFYFISPQSYVSCAWGIHQIGFVMAGFGISAATSSLLFGKLAEYVGRATLFTFGGILNVAVLVTLLLWEPTPDQPHVFFILSAMWGVADGVWSPQIRSMYGTIFKETREAAFSNAGLWLSIGFIIVYLNAGLLCMSLKIYIYLGFLGITLICYYIVEIQIRREKTLPRF